MSIQIGTHQLGCLRLGEVWIGNSACRPALAGEGQIGDRRERYSSNERFTARSSVCRKMHKQLNRQVATGGVTSDGDLREASLGQTDIASPDIFNGSRKWMLRSKPVVRHEGHY